MPVKWYSSIFVLFDTQFLLSFPYHLYYTSRFLMVCRTSFFWFSSIVNLYKSKLCWSVQFSLCGWVGGIDKPCRWLQKQETQLGQSPSQGLRPLCFLLLKVILRWKFRSAPIQGWVSSLYPAKCGVFCKFVVLFVFSLHNTMLRILTDFTSCSYSAYWL